MITLTKLKDLLIVNYSTIDILNNIAWCCVLDKNKIKTSLCLEKKIRKACEITEDGLCVNQNAVEMWKPKSVPIKGGKKKEK